MALISGILKKMKTQLADPVQYWLRVGDTDVALNPSLHNQLRISFTGNIFCIQCGRKTKQSFQQGHCFPCMQRLNECNLCVIHPERCRVEEGQCAVDDWAHAHCHQEHIIYLANSSGLKVGVTRHTQVPIRWIDQGATQALPIYRAANRYQAGLVEVIFKQYVQDKTQWQAMLKQAPLTLDLSTERDRLCTAAAVGLAALRAKYPLVVPVESAEAVLCNFPVLEYPRKITSLNLDKTATVAGKLLGIKGQYLILESGVINIRKYGGYEVEFSNDK